MKSVLAALRTLAVLVVSVAVLALVAWLAGELPARDATALRRAAEETRLRAERADAAVQAARAAEAAVAAADAGVEEPAPEIARATRHRVCDEAANASLMRTRLDARGRELLAIGCGDTLTVLGFVDATPLVVAQLAPVAANQTAPVRRFTLVADDVTGDGVIDWLVGTMRSVDVASPAVGSLHLVPGDARGGLGEPQLLAPLAVAGIDVGPANDDEVLDVAVLHRPDAVGARAPEAWVFRGGASMVRMARVTLPADAIAIALVDLDADGKTDLFPLRGTTASIRANAGDGSGNFSRALEFQAAAAQNLERSPLPGTGPRLLLAGPTPSWLVSAAPVPTIVPYGIPASPIANDLHASSENGKLRLAWLVDGVVHWYDVATEEPAQLADVTIPSSEGRIADVSVGDFAGGRDLDLALLVEAPGGVHERDLVLLTDFADGNHVVHLASERTTIAQAPMHLTIPLR